MINQALDELLEGEGALLLEPREQFDGAVIGIAERINLRVAAYDSEKVIEALMVHDGMERDEAVEWFEFNIRGAWMGEGSPVFIDPLYGDDD